MPSLYTLKTAGSRKVNAVGKSITDGQSHYFLFLPHCSRSRQIFGLIFPLNRVWLLEHPTQVFSMSPGAVHVPVVGSVQ